MSSPFNPPPPPPFNQSTSSSEAPILIAQGAEGILYKSHHLITSRPCAIKYRPPKTWRHPTLDARLTRHRILAEARILVKCRREGISVPGVLALDWEGSLRRQSEGSGIAEAKAGQQPQRYGGWMMTEWIEGMTVRRALNAWLPRHVAVQKEPTAEERERARASGGESARPEQVKDLMRRIGAEVGKLHQAGVIHGDLTTSNLMIRVKEPGGGSEGMNGDGKDVKEAEGVPRPSLDGQVVIIDFGLATQSSQDEDRAVDLYVLERAYGSTHPDTEDLFDVLLDAYRVSFKTAHIALKRLDEVRLRGRKKSMLG